MTPMQLSTERIRGMDLDYEIVEHRIDAPHWARKKTQTIKIDFCGFADILAWGEDLSGCVLAVNPCGPSDIPQHTARYKDPKEKRGRRRIAIVDRLRSWISGGHRFQIWSWDQTGDELGLLVLEARFVKGRLTFPMMNVVK